MKRTLFFLVLCCICMAYRLPAGQSELFEKSLTQPTPLSEARQNLQNRAWLGPLSEEEELGATGKRSVGRAVVFSAIVPGTGQLYNKSVVKGVAFLAVEALSLAGHFYYQNQGSDKETQFEAYADARWVEDDYWDWMSQISGISRDDMQGLRDFEHANFSHFLPDKRNQQYYENIGKYDQFNVGWVDTDNGGARDSEFRENYTLLRKDANDDFKRATTLATVILLNHLVSAVEAGLAAKRYNSGLTAQIGVRGMINQHEVAPALEIRLTW